MTDRAKEFMNAIWEARNNGADTEEQLVAEILKLLPSKVKFYNAQNGIIVLDQNDLLKLAEELNETS
jgi:hypothetical protein